MVIRVKLPDGNYGNFPDSMSHSEIESVLQKQFGKPESALSRGFKQVGKDWTRFGQDVGAGLLEAARGIGNIPHAFHLPNAPYFEPTNFAQMLGMRKEPELLDKLLQGLAQYAPSFALPAANIGRAGQALQSIPKAGKFAAGALEQAIPQAVYGATQNESPMAGALEGGLGSLAGSAIGKGLESTINTLRPSRILRGELSSEQLAKNLETTKGTETGLGEIIGSPTLKRLHENILPHVIGSGAEKVMMKNANKITQKGEKLLSDLTGKVPPEDFGSKIQEALKNSAKDVEQIKRDKFQKVNDIAEESKVTTDRSNLRKAAENSLKQIKSDPDLAKFANPSDIKLLEEIAYGTTKNPELIDVITGKSISEPKNYSIKNTDILRGKIGEMAHEAFSKGEQPKYSIYKNLKSALEKDVSEAIQNSGSEELKNAHKKAMEYYKNEYAPYEDPDLRKFIKKGGDPDLIMSHFIKGGKNDRARLLTKLTKGMLQEPNGTKNLLAGSYFSQAVDNEGILNPVKLSTLYHKLGKNQRKALFGDEKLHNEFKNYVDLINKNKESFNLMFNPKTGARNTGTLGHIGSLIAGGLTGSIPGFLGSLAGTAALGKGATKLLTSPKYREKIVNAMIKNKKIEMPKTKQALQKGGAIASGLGGNDTEQNPLELEVIGKRK